MKVFLTVVAHSGDSVILFPLLASFYFFNEEFGYYAGIILICISITTLLVGIIKWIVRRERPNGSDSTFYLRSDRWSFPSGHAARTFSIAILIAGTGNFTAAILLFSWSVMVSVARVSLSLHHISDILAGMASGLTVALVTLWLI